jgi:hypothetical protein
MKTTLTTMKTIVVALFAVLGLSGCVAVPYDGYGYGPSVVVQPSFGYYGYHSYRGRHRW